MLWWAYGLYITSLFVQMAYLVLGAVTKEPTPAVLIFAGVLGLINFMLTPAALGVLLAGPNRASMKAYGSAALVAAVVHLILLVALMAKTSREIDGYDAPGSSSSRLMVLASAPTQIPSLSSYVALLAFPDNIYGAIRYGWLSIITGLAEVLQLMLTMLTLMCLARAGGDDDLGYRCIRAGAMSVFVLGGMVLGMLALIAIMIHSGAILTSTGRILLAVAWMSLNGVLCLMLLLPLRRSQDAMDRCLSPLLVDEKYR